MSVSAKLNYLRIAPRKVRLLADLVRGKSVQEAQNILNFTVKKSATPLLKLLKQAMANAQNNFQLDTSNLYISKITVDEGPKNKRWRPRARGQTYEIQKKTSHLTIVLEERISSSPPFAAARVLDEKIKAKKIGEPEEKIAKIEKPRPKVKSSTERTKFKSEIKEKKPPKQSRFATGQAKIESQRDKSLLHLASLGKGGIKRIFRRKAF